MKQPGKIILITCVLFFFKVKILFRLISQCVVQYNASFQWQRFGSTETP